MKTLQQGLVILTILLTASCKKETTQKVRTLEMKVNGVNWTATKNIAGYYNTASGGITITGQTADESISLTRDSISGFGTFAIPRGNINGLFLKNGSLMPFTASSSASNSHGSVRFFNRINDNALANYENIEADFSGVLYNSFHTDSVVITDGKLRYQ
ncbi:MAG: hypothetical protein U0T73_12450 [Chitinophagales bacterium]